MKSLLKIAVIIHLGVMLGFAFLGTHIIETQNIPADSMEAALLVAIIGPMFALPVYLPCLILSTLGIYFFVVKPEIDAQIERDGGRIEP